MTKLCQMLVHLVIQMILPYQTIHVIIFILKANFSVTCILIMHTVHVLFYYKTKMTS